MADTLPKGYEPHAVEDALARPAGRTTGPSRPTPTPRANPFSIVIPPPNVTGALHIGHALNHTLIDVLCRHARQKGKNVLSAPRHRPRRHSPPRTSCKRALAKEGKTRHDLGREAFVERVWQWREDYGQPHPQPESAPSATSVDWTRQRFTMDEGLSAGRPQGLRAALQRRPASTRATTSSTGARRCHTALADDEVEHEARQGPPVPRSATIFEPTAPARVTIATTRPETIPGGHRRLRASRGRALCRRLVGDRAVVPVHRPRRAAVIADRYVDQRVRHRRPQGHPLPRPQRLGPRQERHGLEFLQCHRRGRQHDRRGRPLRRPDQGRLPHAASWPSICRPPATSLADRGPRSTPWATATAATPWSSRMCPTRWSVATTKLAPTRPRRRARTDPASSPESWAKTYYQLARQHPRLVHQPPDLVGPPHPRLDLPPVRRAHRGRARSHAPAPSAAPRTWSSRVRRARHLVLLRPVALHHHGLARADQGSGRLVSHQRAGDRFRHHLLLGGPHDDDGPALHGPGALPRRVPARPGA